MGIMLILVFLVGLGAGCLVMVLGGYLSTIVSKDSKELRHTKKNLNLALDGLRKAMDPTRDPVLEASATFAAIDVNNDNYTEGK